jgi:hypothetical protein
MASDSKECNLLCQPYANVSTMFSHIAVLVQTGEVVQTLSQLQDIDQVHVISAGIVPRTHNSSVPPFPHHPGPSSLLHRMEII